jgi:hypothetical protein
VPSPLYRSYRVLWDFSPSTLILIYTTNAFGVLATLLRSHGSVDVTLLWAPAREREARTR